MAKRHTGPVPFGTLRVVERPETSDCVLLDDDGRVVAIVYNVAHAYYFESLPVLLDTCIQTAHGLADHILSLKGAIATTLKN